MEPLAIIAALLGILALFDLSALHMGADSRDGMGDDWARPTLG